MHENIIILGSKPNVEYQKKCNAIKNQEPKLILKNISYFLNRCRRYCKDCQILFPKANILNLHMYNIHTQKKDNLNSNSRELNTKYKCNTCNTRFTLKSNLIRHIRKAHRNFGTINNSNKKIVLSENSNNELAKGHSCFHCQQLFPTTNSLIEHLYDVMKPKNIEAVNSCSSSSTIPNKANEEESSIKQSNENLDVSKNFDGIKFKNNLHAQEKIDQHSMKNHVNYKTDLKKHNYISDDIDQIPLRGSSSSVVGFSDYDEKVTNKCKVNKDPKQEQYKSYNLDPKIKYNKCTEQFGSQGELEYHNQKQKDVIEKINAKSKMKKHCIKKLNKKECTLKLTGMLYQCFICSKYNLTFEFYACHVINDHNIKEVARAKKVLFDSQCKFCTSKLANMKYYNVHLYKYHKNLLKKGSVPRKNQEVKINSERRGSSNEFNFALNSILYQCTKCDTFFLSTKAAKSHMEHIKILDDWKCSDCERIFKKKDKALHLRQHLFTQKFNVYALSGSEFSRILYKCIKCAVHYSEKQYSLHYSKCGTETPDSLYCITCDILINKNDMDFHELNHKDKKMQCSDFIIIESEIIDRRINPNRDKNKRAISNVDNRNEISENILEKSKFAMAYCHTCKCFINNVHLTRNVHIEARCGHMLRTVCQECGLILTMKTHTTHQKLHKNKKINLQHYSFYDLNSQKQICPPIPEFPSCESCGVQFLRKKAIRIHSCDQQDFMTCNICLNKFTEHAYRLHMAYHNYSIQKENKKRKLLELELSPTNETYTDPNSSGLDNFNLTDFPFLYTCRGCQITLNTYDRAVEHCQDHYDCKDIQLNTQKCQHCILTFDNRGYENHKNMHLNGKCNKDSITVVEFDPFYFRFNNEFWKKHIFAYVADEQISKILDASIYKYECRLKMEELQSGSSSMTFYKCEKCQAYVEPRSLYLHVKNSTITSCVDLKRHPCSFCDLCFVSEIHRVAHEKEHNGIDINLKSYKIILFNKIEHETFNNIMFEAYNRYILYQCRNCEQVVDKLQRKIHKCDVNNLKICPTCGLLIHMQDYDLHFIRHEELDKFNPENMIVMMFGKLLYLRKKSLRSTFSGTKYDYTIYKCNNCELCFRTKLCTSRHVCVSENSKLKCTKCGLYFSELELKYHSRQHDTSLGFDECNLNLITFDASSPNHVNSKDSVVESNDAKKQIEQPVDKNESVKENINNCSEKLEKMYKCECGLHFLEEINAQKHANNCNARIKISKQSCFKCDLLFTPGELFNHLLKHHCDKKLQFKFDIVIVYKKDEKTDKL